MTDTPYTSEDLPEAETPPRPESDRTLPESGDGSEEATENDTLGAE